MEATLEIIFWLVMGGFLWFVAARAQIAQNKKFKNKDGGGENS